MIIGDLNSGSMVIADLKVWLKAHYREGASAKVQTRLARNMQTVIGGMDAKYAAVLPIAATSTKRNTSKLVDPAPAAWTITYRSRARTESRAPNVHARLTR